MTTKYGMFKEHEYFAAGASPGNRDHSASKDASREIGLNFKATVGRTGKNNDATFSKFTSLHEGDRFIDPARRKLLQNREEKSHNVTETPFKTISPMKKSMGPGDYYGTLGGKIPHEPGNLETKLKKGDVQGQMRGMYTNPPKKGTFGYNKTTLSERVGFKGVATEYEYHAEPLSLQQAKKVEQMEQERKARISELPFKPSHPPKKGTYGVPNTTISKGKGVAGEWEYVMVGDVKDQQQGAGSQEGDSQKNETPFKPSNIFVSQRINHIEYIHDPEVPKQKAEAERKKQEAARLAASGPWRPNMSYKTDMVRSIVRMNI